MSPHKLYNYVRSSASYRVRICLNLKNIDYQMIPISLLDNQQQSQEYLDINPQGLVPTWVDDDISLSQSLAIIEYLDERYPTPLLLPNDIFLKARVRQFSLIIACETHPLNNLCVRQYLLKENWSEEKVTQWMYHWFQKGFAAYEAILQKYHLGQKFTLNETLSMADICLVPQVYNALRFKFNMQDYPFIMNIYQHCQQLDAFKKAAPDE